MRQTVVLLLKISFSVDMDKVLETKNKVVNTLVGGVAGLLRSYGVDVPEVPVPLRKIRMSWLMVLNCLKRRKSSLLVVPKSARLTFQVWNHPLSWRVMISLEMNEVPESLVIIGGGVVGIELGQAFMTFGSKSYGYWNDGPHRSSYGCGSDLRTFAWSLNVGVWQSWRIRNCKKSLREDGKLRIKVEGKDDIIANKALLSIGRVPDLEGIGEVEFELDRGRIKSMNTWKHLFQASMRQAISTVLRCWLTLCLPYGWSSGWKRP